MSDLIAQIINAIMLGSTYAVVALGIVLIYNVLDVLSIAQGQILIAAAYVGLVLVLGATGSVLLAALATVAAAFVLGIIVERVAVRYVAHGGHMATLVTTLGAGMVIINALILIAGPYQRGVSTGGVATNFAVVSGAPVTYAEVLSVVCLGAGFAGVYWVTQMTGVGRMVRATAENPQVAAVFGVDIRRVRMLTFAAGSALAGLAGVMLVLRYGYVSPTLGVTFTLNALTVVLLGGAGSITGTAIASFGLAFVEVGAIKYIGPDYGDVLAFGLLFVFLIVRPRGLFARVERQGG